MSESTSSPPPYGPASFKQLQLSPEEQDHYYAIGNDPGRRRQVAETIVEPRTGGVFSVRKGQLVKIACCKDAQVADLNVFNADNSQEQFSATQTRMVHGTHLTAGTRLWSHPIYQRPMMTIISDSVEHSFGPKQERPHDLLFGMCDEGIYRRLTGRIGMPNCRDNLTRAVAELGLSPDHVHDPFNIFMTTGVDGEGRLFYTPPRATKGDFLSMYAEMNCLCAISACPGASSGPNPGGLAIEVFEIAEPR